jgi:hypothetical protein
LIAHWGATPCIKDLRTCPKVRPTKQLLIHDAATRQSCPQGSPAMCRCPVSPDLPFQDRRNDARLIAQRVRAFLNLVWDFVEDVLRSRLDFLVLLLRGGLELFTVFSALWCITGEGPLLCQVRLFIWAACLSSARVHQPGHPGTRQFPLRVDLRPFCRASCEEFRGRPNLS